MHSNINKNRPEWGVPAFDNILLKFNENFIIQINFCMKNG